jgi:protein-serine/threonine kinase
MIGESVSASVNQLSIRISALIIRHTAHNDIKPANILLSHSDIPVLVDFGFAQRWDLTNTDGRGPTEVSGLAVSSHKSGSRQVPFWSEISWGTPEYLDPPVSVPRSICYGVLSRLILAVFLS